MKLFSRIEREKRTVEIMVKMFCKHNHNNDRNICTDCKELINFANERIGKCIFQNDKPVCSECKIHCYRQEMREKIKGVMRYAGPRMIYSHPIVGIRHLIDKQKFKYIDPKVYKSLKTNK